MKKIAVIEDNHEMRENIQEMLELADYKVVTAANGKLGVELVKKELPDLVVCDVMMPELDGYGVLFYLSKTNETKDIPFIFLTAKAEKSDFRKGMNSGADDYITKPFEEMDLLQAIDSRLSKRERLNAVLNANRKWDALKVTLGEIDSLGQLKDEGIVKHFGKKTIVYNEAESSKYLYHVIEGHIRTYKVSVDGKEFVTGIYGPGDFFGYKELLSGKLYDEYAASIEKTSLSLIPADEFEKLMYSDKEVSMTFINILAGNVIDKEQELVNLAYSSVRKRVADALVKLFDKYKHKHADRVEISVSRDELASIVGTATESVIRILSEFKADGFIKSKGSLITILNIDALREYKY